MLEIIKTYVLQFKLYIYVALAAFVVTAWLFDRHAQYNAGVAHCTEQQHEAETKYEQGQKTKQESEKQAAVKKADQAAKQTSDMAHEKDVLIQSIDSKCVLSDDERVRFNEALDRLQK